jgi:folate-binding protein YgfZ
VQTAALDHAIVARTECAVVDVTGPGAVDCIQGIVTNDVVAAGPAGFAFAATLTPKGMILSDLWIARRENALTLFAPAAGLPALRDVLGRTLPPRLARTTERADVTCLRMVGPHAIRLAERVTGTVPEPGRSTVQDVDGASWSIARPALDRPFALQLAGPTEGLERLLARARAAGLTIADEAALEFARILAGWPALTREIQEKTLPQEVRFDEIQGVSYSKGCYTGQETVARLHFRGHANRRLLGLRWEATPDPSVPEVALDGRVVGRTTSAAWVDRIGGYMGLAMIRREVPVGAAVQACGTPARTLDLPIDLAE